jgi:alpha-galactosidase/6-phospho-beta-glucosidase family protein
MIKKEIGNLKIAYIGGGSRAWAWTFMTDLALDKDAGGEIRLYDIDQEAVRHNKIIGDSLPENWRYAACNTLPEALDGVDFIIISILPGTFAQMRSDVHLPERLGVYQSVGDTTGPGGIIRAIRTLPMFVEFAQAIRNHAPDAWVINYTNPMALCLRTLYHVFPKIKAFGCCHEVFGTQELLAQMVERKLEVDGVKRQDIEVNVLGLNHFTWFSNASYKGYFLMDIYREFSEEFYETGFSSGETELLNQSFTCTHRVKFDLFKRFGWIAAAGDRHLAEFMPGGDYLKDTETVKRWGFYLTSVDWREDDLRRRLEKSAKLVSGEIKMTMRSSGEEGVAIIKALSGTGRMISNVNVPNYGGQIPNLPTETVVETNAVFSLNDVRPVYAGALSDNIYKLIAPHAENQTVILNAALNCDRNSLYGAFERDPLLYGRVTGAELRILADDMIKNTLKYLPKCWE